MASLTSDIATAVWSSGTRSLTTFGTLAADVWANGTRTLTGASLSTGSLATLSDIQTATSSLGSAITAGTASVNANTNTQVATVNTTVTNASTSLAQGTASLATTLSSISSAITAVPGNVWASATRSLTSGTSIAADIWAAGTRTLTGASLSTGSLATLSDVTTNTTNVNAHTDSALASASTSIVASVNTNTNTQTSAVSSSVNTNTNTVVGNASSSLASAITAIPANVWSFASRSLTTFGTLASDVWSAPVRTLTSLSLSSQSPWSVGMSNSNTVSAGGTFLATITTHYNGTLTDSGTTPTITIYDANRNVVVSNVPATRSSTGVYNYSYTTASNAAAGTWEALVTANVASGQSLIADNYWTVNTAPPQVIIQSMQSTQVPDIAANVRITNEGQIDYEYQYEWCVVSNINDPCGSNSNISFNAAAKLIHPGDNFDTTLHATVPAAGTYYFKVAVFYGVDNSRSVVQFNATAATSGNGGNTSGGVAGGGGGGGSGAAAIVPQTIPLNGSGSCSGADLNGDGRVNTIDFSILLSYWKKAPPYKNTCVDINHDGKVDGRDFSMLLAQWGSVVAKSKNSN